MALTISICMNDQFDGRADTQEVDLCGKVPTRQWITINVKEFEMMIWE
jgi:hypothetical protein